MAKKTLPVNRRYHTAQSKLPPIQADNTARVLEVLPMMEPGTKVYRLGRRSIFVSPPYQGFGWHLSIAHPDRLPTWDEVAKARYELLPADITVAMILPPFAEYVNIHEFCYHLHQIPPESEHWGLKP